jgi:hypothetical protein
VFSSSLLDVSASEDCAAARGCSRDAPQPA